MTRIYRSLWYLVLLLFCQYCVSTADDTPEVSLASAKENFKNGNYEYVNSQLGEFKTKYPESPLIPEVDLLLADTRFKMGDYEEAIFDYEEFTTLYPDHPRIDYAKYQIGNSYWMESSAKSDQDQEFTKQAMAEWNKLIQEYPQSNYIADAQKNIMTGRKRILGQEVFVAKYYCRRDLFVGCVFRNLKIVEDYPNEIQLVKESKLRAAHALKKLAKQKNQKPDDDSTVMFKDMTEAQLLEKSEQLLKEAT